MHEKIKELRFDSKSAQEFFVKKLAYVIGPKQLKKLLEEGNVIVVDIRDPEQYNEGHIPTAISIPKHEIDKNTDKLSKDKLTIVYGCSEYCSAAAFACLTLADYEYPCVMMNGGYNAWSEFYRFAVVKED